MRYEEARMLITDGDLIAVREKDGFLTPFTKFFTHSKITHTGIAHWMDGGLWMTEINIGKNHAIPLSQLADTPFDVFHPPVDNPLGAREAIATALRIKIPYGSVALIVIGLLNFFRIKTFVHARRVLVCTGFCVKIYEMMGWGEHTYILSPQELTDMLKIKLYVRP